MHRHRPLHVLMATALTLVVLGAMASLAFADDHDDKAAPDDTARGAEENGGSGQLATGSDDQGFPSTGPDFEEAACAFPVEEGAPVDCGYLTVPANRDAPEEGEVRLHVALFHSQADEPADEPVVVLAGGPGESLLEQLGGIGGAAALPFLLNNDVIVLDQRGVGFSEPAPDCPELNEVNQSMLEDGLSDEEMIDEAMAAISECKERLSGEGIDTSIFSTPESAADLEALRQALGYDQWDLYGISYGTRLALTTMREFPDGIRSVILDATYPVEANLFTATPANANRAFDRLFQSCADDSDCANAHPDLEATFHDVVDRLNDEPVTLDLVDSMTGETIEATIDGGDFTGFIFQSLYATPLIPLLPSIITQADEGEFGTVAAIAGRLMGVQEFINMPMHFSVHCREDVSFTTEEEIANATADYPYLEPVFSSAVQTGTSILDVCDIWDAGMADQSWKEPVTSDIPTLILSGEFDPITPPSWAEQVNEDLSNSYLFTFPNVGHGSLFAEPCASEIALIFLEAPSTEPDSPCVDELSGPAFEEPLGEINMVPFTYEDLGFSGLVPEGWIEVQPGVWIRSEAGLVVLSQSAIPGITAEEALANISSLLGLPESPEPTGTCCGGEIEWHIYEIDTAGTPADLAIAEAEGTTYLVSLEGIATAWEQLREQVFFPAVEAFTPLASEPGEGPPTGETPGEGTPPGEFKVHIWWPSDGTTVSGIAPIHAILEGHNVDEYDMFWRADGDKLVPMWNKMNHQTPHKKAYIDYHQWDWSESDDLYDIEVIAFAKDGRELGRSMVTIRHPSD